MRTRNAKYVFSRSVYWLLISTLLFALTVGIAQASVTPGTGWDERTVNGADFSQDAVVVRAGYDIDGDGYGEFIVQLAEDGQSGADDLLIFEATGDNTYSKVWGVDLGSDSGDGSGRGLFVGDSDGDGNVEIIVGRVDTDSILIYEYSGSGQITDGSNPSETPIATLNTGGSTIRGIIVTDLDQDGNNEIIAATIDNTNGLYAYETDGDNSYAAAITYDVGEGDGYDGCDGVAGVNVDLDGDGTREIAVSGGGERLYIFTFDGTAFTEEFDSGDLGDEGAPIQPGDNYIAVYNLDQTGRPEIIISNQRDDEIYVFEGTAADTYSKDATDEVIDNGGENISAIAVGNIVGDSKGEIYYEDASGVVSYREFTGSAGNFNTTDFSAEQTLASASETLFFGIGYGNGASNGILPSLDGDNYRDIVLVRNSGTGNEIYVLESQTSKDPTAIVLSNLTASVRVQPLVLPIALAGLFLGTLVLVRRKR